MQPFFGQSMLACPVSQACINIGNFRAQSPGMQGSTSQQELFKVQDSGPAVADSHGLGFRGLGFRVLTLTLGQAWQGLQ